MPISAPIGGVGWGSKSSQGRGACLEELEGSANVVKAAFVVPPDANLSRQQVAQWRGLGSLIWFPSVVTIITVKHGAGFGHPQFDMGNLG